jgi:flagellar basal body-associated protein FliL
MPKTSQQRTQSELHPQPSQMPSPQMETKKPKSYKRLWLLTGVLVLVLIVSVAAAWQVSKSSQLKKTTTQATQVNSYHANYPEGAGPQPGAVTHDMDHTLTVDPAQATHDMDHVLTIDPVQATHDMDHVLTVGP